MTIQRFDSARPTNGHSGIGERHVQFERVVRMRVDETDEWIDVPLRSVFTDDGISGWSFEVGPYSVEGADAVALINALAEYGRLSGDFRRAGGVA